MAQIKIAITDDHRLFSDALAELLSGIETFQVVYKAKSAKEILEYIVNPVDGIPDVVLMDINMEEVDGVEATRTLTQFYPKLRVIALSMHSDEDHILKMLNAGARGYLSKDTSPEELKRAIDIVMLRGYYHSELVSKYFNQENVKETEQELFKEISERELEFLRLACTEKTYKEIASIMNVSARTVDGYRESLFLKLKVKSRVGLVLFAFVNGIVKQ